MRKTDEPNILSQPELLAALRGRRVYITTKMDGQSASFYWRGGTFGVCSRNLELRDTPNSPFWNIARKYNISEIMAAAGRDFVLQGELYGPAIQGNKMGAPERALALFNCFDPGHHSFLSCDDPAALYYRAAIPSVPEI